MRQLGSQPPAGVRIDLFHRDADGKSPGALAERPRGTGEAVQVAGKLLFDGGPGTVEVNAAILAAPVSAGGFGQQKFAERGTYRPPERMNRAKSQDRGLSIPAGTAELLAAVGRWGGLERPGRIGAQFGWNAESCQSLARLLIRSEEQGLVTIALDQPLQVWVHAAGLGAVAYGQSVTGRGQAECAHHHGGQRV